jgi:hypothetical protein
VLVGGHSLFDSPSEVVEGTASELDGVDARSGCRDWAMRTDVGTRWSLIASIPEGRSALDATESKADVDAAVTSGGRAAGGECASLPGEAIEGPLECVGEVLAADDSEPRLPVSFCRSGGAVTA